MIIGCDLGSEDRSVLSWKLNDDTGFCALPKRGERLVHFPDQTGMRAFGSVNWRKAKRWLRSGRAQPVNLNG